ncbi:helicase-related protein [Desulfotomaculum nigrificans]|uniref:helicase-related protein n=1 Tax=Desulfotomaculum nigrificans TaxID=1565 RepID=UPI0001FAE6FB|nr:helicase-related protein [Desulfotomaculum nigrificans]
MNEVISSNEQLIAKINEVLKVRKGRKINIINDKLTLSVFGELSKNLKNVERINFIIRNTAYVPAGRELPREFEIRQNDTDLFFNSYDIIQKNKLQHLAKAKSMYEFIQKHVNVRKAKEPGKITGNIIMIDDEIAIHGTSSLEVSRKTKRGELAPIHFNSAVTEKAQLEHFQRLFNIIWNNNDYTEDYKMQLLESLNYVYKDYSPEFLYYFTLKELFGSQLDSGVERFERDKTGFKKSVIWNSLYDFQKDAVVSAIQKINKYNGCIIADSVGLGKTFEALAVIKWFELREDNVLVLCPAKLYDNWDSFKNPYIDNAFVKDNFNYKILCHTDLTRTKGYSRSGIDLSRVNWSNFDLVVIDESHNFRNRNEDIEHMSRYMKLMNDIIKKGHGTSRRLIARIDSYIDVISRCNSGEVELIGGEYLEEDVTLDYKYEIKVEHLIAADFLEDLYYDKEILEGLYRNVLHVLNEKRDAKLKKLEEIIVNKIIKTPYNPGNRKMLIFSAFADTANYLYDSIADELAKHGINIACITGSGEPRTTMKNVRCEFNTILRHFSPKSKLGQDLPKDKQIDVVIATDCISEGQNLQDCDAVINYDIQWNPVVLIQRFGRIDRIGSQNKKIAMINFFPNLALNDYLQLEQRVRGKMMAVNLTASGDEDFLSLEMNDFLFRKKQLERLQKEVIEIDELNDNISLTDLNMNDYLYELSNYIKNNPEIMRVPRGVYSVAEGERKGCIFCFKHQNEVAKPANESSLYPYYIMYISNDGEIY